VVGRRSRGWGGERDRGRSETRVKEREANIWVLRVVGWYGVWNIEVDWCRKIGTELQNIDDEAGIFRLEVEFGV
jgi:hypothetical protein